MKISFNNKLDHKDRLKVMRGVAKFLEALADQEFSIADLTLEFDC
jgi:hypothetical protein